MPESDLLTCTITRIVPFEENVRLFCLGGSRELSFHQGQFVTLFDDRGKSCYFALASPPSRKECIELLVKKNGGVSDYLFRKKVGDSVGLKGPLGKGFPLDPFVGKNLLFIGVGTAIAPLRSTLVTALERRSDFNRIALYFGTLTPNHLFFGEEMREWHKKGAEIHITVTFPDETWDSHSGFVQDILSQSNDPLHETVAYVCGMKEMVDATIKVLKERMVPESLILQNF